MSRMVSYQAVSKIVASWTTAGSLLATGRLAANSSGHRQCAAQSFSLLLVLLTILMVLLMDIFLIDEEEQEEKV